MLRVCDTDNDEGLDSLEMTKSNCLVICKGLFGLNTLDIRKIFDKIDQNGDGIITEIELKTQLQKYFHRTHKKNR